MITREQALEFLHKNMQNLNLRRHCYAVEAVMKALARHFGEDEKSWGLAGLLHDADYELCKNDPKQHIRKTVEWLEKQKADKKIIDAVIAHGYKYVDWASEPTNRMEWSLYCCDELTGLIVTVALVKGKKLENVRVDSVLKKFPQKAFAAGVDREQIKLCEKELSIPLPKFIEISLTAMQKINKDLGL